jgi:hypothetical protein
MDRVRYRLVVHGELGPRYAAAFEGMAVRCCSGTTTIVGPVKDQAHLRGLLDRVSALGLELLSVTREEAGPADGG